MKVRLENPNNLCRYIVTSESETGREYVVDLCQFPVGLDKDGVMEYNGACTETHDLHKDIWYEYGCRDFIYRCERPIKQPENMGKIFRCKHIRSAREFALKLIVQHLGANHNAQDTA